MDFTFLARSLSDKFRVIALDLPGRGQSDWLTDKRGYRQEIYMQDLRALYDTLSIEQAVVVGASMGGFLGIRLAAESRCLALGLVDVGPFVPGIYGKYIGNLLGSVPNILSSNEAMAWLRKLMGDPGHLDDDLWEQILRFSSTKPAGDNRQLAFDPGIGYNYLASNEADLDLWSEWEGIRCPVFVMRAERSRVLSSELLQAMAVRTKAPFLSHQLPNCGHCPHLLSKSHIHPLTDWLGRLIEKESYAPRSLS
jgi:pimeloyl-ACP methyl ester carboxylesterase